MKIVLTSIAAALMATAAAAQTAPTDQSTTAPTTSTMTPSTSVDPSATPPAADTGIAADATTLTEKNGKWYAGDREATKTEIAAYKKAKKAGRPG